jgi:two-component system nitrogen regulation sensor histidine kinase GlnL
MEIFGYRLGSTFVHLSPFFASSSKEGVMLIFEPIPENNPLAGELLPFIKGLLHEIGNPLGGIKGAAKLLKELESYDEELVELIAEEAERIERLLKGVVEGNDFSAPSFRCENIHKIVQRAVNLLSAKISKEGVEVKYLFDPSLPEVMVDPDKLLQAFINIVKNAVEAMEESEKRELLIRTGYMIRPSGFIFVEFEDSGVGMDEEELSAFFLPFRTSKEGGMGIGNFISREIIRGHGGEVKVQSKRGEGTKITVMLPLKGRDGKNPCG